MKKEILRRSILLCILSFMAASLYAGSKRSAQQQQIDEDELLAQKEKESVIEINPSASYESPEIEGNGVAFNEVWGYVMDGREYEFNNSMPVTDLCYFSADVNCYGEISSIPDPKKIKGYTGRIHLVVTCESTSLSHFILEPKYGIRQELIKTLADAVKNYEYDGIQIDFELIPQKDAKNFRSFLKDLGEKAGSDKLLSVALPARIKDINDDKYSYSLIEPIVNRIIVMAYDQHWATSAPGPVAGMKWCESIADYSIKKIPEDKLVMGLPFYGRSWQNTNYGKAWYNSSINKVLEENGCNYVGREDNVPFFNFNVEIEVTGYFDDAFSLVKRCELYDSKQIKKIAFWRIGQEDPLFWKYLSIKTEDQE